MEIENGGNQVVTPTTQPAPQVQQPAQTEMGEQQAPKTYTKEQVIDLMKKRISRSHNAFFKRYGVNDLKGLDDLFEKTKSYDQMSNDFGAIQVRNSELVRENAFLRNNINPERSDDIIAYFKGKGMEFSEEALLQAVATHPEWLKPSTTPAPTPVTTITTLGNEGNAKPKVNEKALASKYLGVNID